MVASTHVKTALETAEIFDALKFDIFAVTVAKDIKVRGGQ